MIPITKGKREVVYVVGEQGNQEAAPLRSHHKVQHKTRTVHFDLDSVQKRTKFLKFMDDWKHETQIVQRSNTGVQVIILNPKDWVVYEPGEETPSERASRELKSKGGFTRTVPRRGDRLRRMSESLAAAQVDGVPPEPLDDGNLDAVQKAISKYAATLLPDGTVIDISIKLPDELSHIWLDRKIELHGDPEILRADAYPGEAPPPPSRSETLYKSLTAITGDKANG